MSFLDWLRPKDELASELTMMWEEEITYGTGYQAASQFDAVCESISDNSKMHIINLIEREMNEKQQHWCGVCGWTYEQCNC